jgi:hypothetical protein
MDKEPLEPQTFELILIINNNDLNHRYNLSVQEEIV